MNLNLQHDWNPTPGEAITIQKQLRQHTRMEPFVGDPKLIAAADVSFNRHSPTVYAIWIVMTWPDLEIVERASSIMDVEFPYIPGLLSFRELPPLLSAWETLTHKPDVVIMDGQGIAHPRRVGIATHFGLVSDVPTIGCAKNVLIGSYQEPERIAGSESKLTLGNEQIGVVIRTKNNVRPVYVSPGHRMDFTSATRIIKSTVRGYRIPEPTRQAHLAVNELRIAAGRPLLHQGLNDHNSAF